MKKAKLYLAFTELKNEILEKKDSLNFWRNSLGLTTAEDSEAIQILNQLQIPLQYYRAELKRIPEKGPFLVVVNSRNTHWDALMLLCFVRLKRPDFAILNPEDDSLDPDFFKALESIIPFVKTKYTESVDDLASAFERGEGRGYLMRAKSKKKQVALKVKRLDEKRILTFLADFRAYEVPILPVYLKNGKPIVEPHLKGEKQAWQGRVFRRKATIRVARLLYPKEIKSYREERHLLALLLQRIGILSLSLPQNKKSLFLRRRPSQAEQVEEEPRAEILKSEISFLAAKDKLVLSKKQFAVYLAQAEDIPYLLKQIGRLREISFREIGEGSNKALDLDSYDYHYHHLLLWDTEAECLVGAYRLAYGPQVFKRFGINGFYTHSLFKIDSAAYPIFENSLELGRAFIVKEYQQKPLPLFILWNAIKKLMARDENLQYILGCASISNRFSSFSKSLIVKYLLENHGDVSLANLVKPRKAFKQDVNLLNKKGLWDNIPSDMVAFDRKLEEIEPGSIRIPPLIKKYIQSQALVLCFNIDPLFNNSLDGFMYIKRKELDLPSQGHS
ncbi:MAG: glycerol acyltransferase [Bacteroidetes bacterium]|nr:MAG: glycerol acyltransferase [Bacteroidota bacterium]